MITDYFFNQLDDYIESDTDYRFNCPFCDDGRNKHKLYVSKENDLWHCFNCGRSGKLSSFISQYEGISYGKAVKISNQYGGITSTYYPEGNELSDSDKLNLMLLSVDKVKDNPIGKLKMAPMIKGYHKLINNYHNPVAYPYFNYCKRRNFTLRDIALHDIGYVDHGQVKLPNGKTITINYSLVFITKDLNNHYIYWNTRSIEPNPITKSFNCPEYPDSYSKGTCLFNFNNAIKQDNIVITEGVPDSLTLGLSGIGTFGKQVTDDQVKLILDHVKDNQKIYVMLDMDAKYQMESLAKRLYSQHEETYIVINSTNRDANSLGKDQAWQIINTESVKADISGIIKLKLS